MPVLLHEGGLIRNCSFCRGLEKADYRERRFEYEIRYPKMIKTIWKSFKGIVGRLFESMGPWKIFAFLPTQGLISFGG